MPGFFPVLTKASTVVTLFAGFSWQSLSRVLKLHRSMPSPDFQLLTRRQGVLLPTTMAGSPFRFSRAPGYSVFDVLRIRTRDPLKRKARLNHFTSGRAARDSTIAISVSLGEHRGNALVCVWECLPKVEPDRPVLRERTS